MEEEEVGGGCDGEVGNVAEHGLGPNGDIGGTGRRDSSFGGVPNDDIESKRQSI